MLADTRTNNSWNTILIWFRSLTDITQGIIPNLKSICPKKVSISFVFGGIGKILDKAKEAKTITKADWGITSFFNDAWSKVADFFYDESKSKK